MELLLGTNRKFPQSMFFEVTNELVDAHTIFTFEELGTGDQKQSATVSQSL